ncbi:MAG: MotA/TolQ/ExbB proton channel family protein [Deltaproteobacteria bacterium]|jgi:biopolymer transport protein TolQ|nr:MotA/TolQ/ExbB proton channel family protein [Deltaproteobacteria bacterium]
MSPLLQSLQQSGPLAISILLLLLICSVSVWTILISKILVWKKYRSSNKVVLRIFEEENNLFKFIEQTKQCFEGPVQRFVIDASQEIDLLKPLTQSKNEYRSELIDLLDRSFEAMLVHEELKLRTGQSTLATISVTAPFVGLLGTVLGVIDTFQGISQLQSVELTVVGPGISEALVATGAGLFAAIPAVVAYNLFNAYIRDSIEQIESLSLKFLQRLHLQILLTNEKKN